MGFERIGPYKLTPGDTIAASLAISFLIGPISTRLSTAITPLMGLSIIVFAICANQTILVSAGLLLILIQIIIVPVIRSLRSSEEITLGHSVNGLLVETQKMRATLKWPMIGTVRKIGPRVFIMVSAKSALVVSERVTPSQNLDRLVATIDAHR